MSLEKIEARDRADQTEEAERERVARIIDPWTFKQCEWAIANDNDDLLRAYLPARDIALAKADAILAPLKASEARVKVLEEALRGLNDAVDAYWNASPTMRTSDFHIAPVCAAQMKARSALSTHGGGDLELVPESPSADAGTHIPRSPDSLTPLESELLAALQHAVNSLEAMRPTFSQIKDEGHAFHDQVIATAREAIAKAANSQPQSTIVGGSA